MHNEQANSANKLKVPDNAIIGTAILFHVSVTNARNVDWTINIFPHSKTIMLRWEHALIRSLNSKWKFEQNKKKIDSKVYHKMTQTAINVKDSLNDTSVSSILTMNELNLLAS